MDLVDRIETTRFLGAEFLVWLWFAQDVHGGAFGLGALGKVEVSLETQLKLSDLLSPRETIVMRGSDPFGSPEAERALQAGKLPTKALLRIRQGESEWLVALDALSLAMSGVKLPGYEAEEADQLFARMNLLEQLDDMIQDLYRQFLLIRLSATYSQKLLPALRQWVNGALPLDAQGWTQLHRSAAKIGAAKNATRR